MYTTTVILLSAKGKITDTIVDLLPDEYSTKCFDFSGDNLQEIILGEKENFSIADVIILNLSEMNGSHDKFFSEANDLYQHFPVIVLHHYEQKTFADAFIKMGAKAYLPINFYADDLISVIEQVQAKDS